MNILIPCMYADYGRYIDQFRGIPSSIDGLKLSQRRCLLGLYDRTKNDKMVKAAKVVGHVIGSLHPHGDASAYETIKNLAWQGYVDTQGNWGAKDLRGNDRPAAMRYTECKISKWVKDLVFKYYKYVPWENFEYETEPIFLPCIIPIGLVGVDNIYGGGFYKTLIPKYTLNDLVIRLKWLLENQSKFTSTFIEKSDHNYTEEEYGPCIKPAFRDCSCKENNPGDFYRILISGEGQVRAIPNGTISNGKIYVMGKAPTFNSEKIEKDIDNKDVDNGIKKFTDLSTDKKNPFYICGEFIPKNKKINVQNLYKDLFKKYFIKNITYRCYFVSDKIPTQFGIDQILINNYSHYIHTVKTYNIDKCTKLIEKLFTTNILLLIKNIILENKCTSVTDIVNMFINNNVNLTLPKERFEDDTWVVDNIPIDDKIVYDICANKTIKQLVEINQNISSISQEIINCKNDIINVNNTCYHELCGLIK